MDVEQVRPEVTLPLRQRVLRPHETLERLGRNEGPGAAHFAAFSGGAVVGTAAVQPEAPPWEPGAQKSWRIRGMATDPQRRGAGVGRAVLAAALRHCFAHGARQVWCSARIPALGFYSRAGFRERGERWDDPHTGPHVHAEMHPLAVLTHRFQHAVAGRDVRLLERLLHPDFVLTTGRPGAEERTRDAYLAITAREYVIEDFAFEELHAAGYGDAGVVRSRYRQSGSMAGQDRTQAFRLTDVWVEGPARIVTRHAQPLGETAR